MISLLGLGDNTVDTYVDRGMQFPGGNALNVAVMAGRLGLRAGYLGATGNDAGGALVRAALAAEGVDTARLRVRPAANGRARIGHQGSDRRFLSAEPGVRADIRLDADDLRWIAGWDHVHTSVNSDLDDALAELRGHARSLSYDFSEKWTPERLARVVPLVDVVVLSCPNRTEAAVGEVLRHCAALGARVAIGTRGAAGALAWAEGALHAQAPVPAEVIDTLGAGDGFIAGFLAAWLDGQGVAPALAAAAAFAARVCAWQGAFGHGAPWADVSATTG